MGWNMDEEGWVGTWMRRGRVGTWMRRGRVGTWMRRDGLEHG